MTEPSTVEACLVASDAHRSLTTEAAVRESFQLAGWQAKHGAVYRDSREGKFREIDVILSQIWESKRKSDLRAYVYIPVECKTMRGFHLLFPNESISELQYQTADLVAWIGYESSRRKEIAACIAEHGFSDSDVSQFLKRMLSSCYPRQRSRVASLMPNPPPVPATFTAWRETNMGTEKDLDKSVFWRAVLGLNSCVRSIQESWFEGFLEDLSTGGTIHEYYGRPKQEALAGAVSFRSGVLCVFQPVVVTDAPLWIVGDGEVQQVPFARYVRQGVTFLDTNKWFDVVTRDNIDVYVDSLTQHFVKHFKAARCERE